MAIFSTVHTIPLENDYELHVIREDRNKKILLSLNKRSDEGWIRERITIEIPLERAYRMAKFIVGITDAVGESEGFEEEETAEFPAAPDDEGYEEPGEDPGDSSGD